MDAGHGRDLAGAGMGGAGPPPHRRHGRPRRPPGTPDGDPARPGAQGAVPRDDRTGGYGGLRRDGTGRPAPGPRLPAVGSGSRYYPLCRPPPPSPRPPRLSPPPPSPSPPISVPPPS